MNNLSTRALRIACVIGIGVVTSLSPATAEEDSRFTGEAVDVAFLSEALTLPSFRVFNRPVHPGAMAAYERPWKTFDRSYLFIEINAGFYLHEGFQNGVFLGVDVGYNYATSVGLGASVSVGVGYLHTFFPGPVYEHSDGEFEQVRDYGMPHLVVSVPLEIHYNLETLVGIPLTPYVQYRPFVEVPGITGWGIHALPHASILVGTKVHLDTAENRGGAL
ncbi:MAG: hypothetical protein MI724_10440 [Spirochaetales bacterium]|nr:hypothetical protein [Spirochaetales bacterium]